MLSFASKALSVQGSLNGFGPLGQTIGKLLTTNVYERVPTKNLKLSQITIDDIYKHDHSVQDFSGYLEWHKQMRKSENNQQIIYEDPSAFDIYALRGMNTYRWKYKNNVKSLFGIAKKDKDQINAPIISTEIAPALFNPSYGVQTIGITQRVPLLNDQIIKENDIYTSDCSIRRLVHDSMEPNSPLGLAQYRLIDFMYCKDLGKVPNNRLITLRKFAHPVGDHIFRGAGAKYASENFGYDSPGDIGRLVSWFDTDDNKLEDLTKYDVRMSWKEIESAIQEIDSKEDSSNRGIMGMFVNSYSQKYNSFQNDIGGLNQNVFAWLGSKISPNYLSPKSSDNMEVLRMNADNHKVYTPKNTVQDTHLYEGKLTLNQELTLTFSYKLRAYDNINPKSAMLDLIGNVLAVTYKRGSYWGGSRRMIGPPHNSAAWRKANNFIENAWQKMGGFVSGLASGTVDFDSILGGISNAIDFTMEGFDKFLGQFKDTADKFISDPKGTMEEGAQKAAKALTDFDKVTGISKYMKGLLKDNLGRPAMYAADTLVSGEPCGFWHLTIGNPYNPIMSIGNLIMTNSTIQQMGPLGVDDFPTELKVVCTLKPGRSRDMVEVSRYYTQGLNSIYISKVGQPSTDFHNWNVKNKSGNIKLNAFDENKYLKDQAKTRQNNSKSLDPEALMNHNNQNNSNDGSPTEILRKNITNAYKEDYGGAGINININSDTAGRLFTTNNYSQLYYIKAHDEEDYA